MTNWNDRKTKSLSSVPLWLESAIEEYKQREGLQSWSHAIMHLAVFALLRHYSEPENMITFGDKNFEKAMFAELNRLEEETDNMVDMFQFWQDMVAPPKHGDVSRIKRMAEYKKCPQCHGWNIGKSNNQRICADCGWVDNNEGES